MEINEEKAKDKSHQDKVHSKTWSFTLNITNGIKYTIVCTVISVVLSVLASCLYSNYITPKSTENNKSILLLGSGTVYEYLIKNRMTENYYIKNIPVPTYFALKTLREEKSPQFDENNLIHLPINPIFMAAALPDDSVFMRGVEKEQFIDNIGKIISLYLGESNLRVIIYPKGTYKEYIVNDKSITPSELKNILIRSKDDNKVKIFRTSEYSSTKDLFQRIIDYQIPEKDSYFFDMQTRKRDFTRNGTKAIILCNEFYTPDFDEDESATYDVVKDNKNISMSLYLYFTAYKQGENKYVIPEDIKGFIKQIKHDFSLEKYKLDSPDLVIRDPEL